MAKIAAHCAVLRVQELHPPYRSALHSHPLYFPGIRSLNADFIVGRPLFSCAPVPYMTRKFRVPLISSRFSSNMLAFSDLSCCFNRCKRCSFTVWPFRNFHPPAMHPLLEFPKSGRPAHQNQNRVCTWQSDRKNSVTGIGWITHRFIHALIHDWRLPPPQFCCSFAWPPALATTQQSKKKQTPK